MNFDQRRHFQKLFRGTGQMVHELCQAGSYQEGEYQLFKDYFDAFVRYPAGRLDIL